MRNPREAVVAVTGLNATDNPGPGMGVIRALRHHPEFQGRIVGLAYDTLEPGIYAQDLVDDVFLVPYPSQGVAALEERLRYVHAQVGLDAVIPTLDSELPSFVALGDVLEELGIGAFLPTQGQFDLRSKDKLSRLAADAGLNTPATQALADVTDLYTIHDKLGWPIVVKGLLYGAKVCRSVDEAVAAYHSTAAQWGFPVLAQAFLDGDEFDVVAVGDGKGGLVGAVPMRKTWLTDKGKGWAGITVADPALLDVTRRFVEASQWRGAFEAEILRTQDGDYHLLEVNPRFPAWTYLSAGAGMNLPWALLELACGGAVEQLSDYEVGKLFVRISLDQIADLEDLQAMTTDGELRRAASGETR